MTAMPNDTSVNPHDLAAEITRRNASNLWFVGQALPVSKRRLFEASYASMRIIDDFVDDDFLNRSLQERQAGRRDAHDRIERWFAAAAEALSSRSGEIEAEGRDRALFTALAKAKGTSDLPLEPWRALAQAMHSDVEETLLVRWVDFEAYCEGATVAPAAVFIFVLLADPAKDLRAGVSSEALFSWARDMAVFCYLVHIARDFAKDAARGGQLLTIPEECFKAHCLKKSDATDSERVAPLLQELVDRATKRRVLARDCADRLAARLAPREAHILDALLSIYEMLHDDLKVAPRPGQGDRAGLTQRLRSMLAGQLGLG